MSWSLRRAGAEDAETLAETLQIGFDGYRELAPPGWLPPDARTKTEVARLRARLLEPTTWAMLAEEGGLAAGHAGYMPQPGAPDSAHLWQLFVRPPWWGKGVAVALIAAAREAAVADGYGRMRCFTPRDQSRARAFYEREGFVFTGWEALEETLGLVLVEYRREPL